MIRIVPGSKQTLVVDVTDRLATVDDLATLNPTFDVINEADEAMLTDAVPGVSGMQLRCIIDATDENTWVISKYRMYVKFGAPGETPIIGPVRFQIAP